MVNDKAPTILRINLLVPPSATGVSHPKVLSTAVYFRLLAAFTGFGFWSDTIPLSFNCWYSFRPDRTQQKTDQVHVDGGVEETQATSNHLLRANAWLRSIKQWHPRRFGCDCLSNPCRLWRVVTARTLFEVQHPQLTAAIERHRHGHYLLTTNTMTWRPVTGGHQHCPLVTLPKAFRKGLACTLLCSRQNKRRRIWPSPKFSQKCVVEWKPGLWCCCQDENITLYPPPQPQPQKFPGRENTSACKAYKCLMAAAGTRPWWPTTFNLPGFRAFWRRPMRISVRRPAPWSWTHILARWLDLSGEYDLWWMHTTHISRNFT